MNKPRLVHVNCCFLVCIRSYLSKSFPIFIYLVLGFICNSVQADIFKWSDDNGQVHYGDHPGPDAVQLNTHDEPLPDNIIRGLSESDRQQLKRLEQKQAEKQRLREKSQREEKKQQRIEERQARQDARRCRKYSGLVDRYRTKLRAGCKVRQCIEYKQRVRQYRLEMDEYCT